MAILTEFFNNQRNLESIRLPQGSLLAGYVLETGYGTFTVTTNTALQRIAGELPRGGLLLAMAAPSCATLLRVRDVVSSPLGSMERMTFYELGKRAMPELDPLTNTDMSWSCRTCDVLGSFYEMGSAVFFSGDLRGLASPSEYRVYQPGALLELVVNGVYGSESGGLFRAREYTENGAGFVPAADYCVIGRYRPTEFFQNCAAPTCLYLSDIAGHRLALFGKTRSGKSNTAKVITAQLLMRNAVKKDLGQLIIDTNGEYANDNAQDGLCLKSRFPDQCVVYAVQVRPGSTARVLRCNFYLIPQLAMEIFRNKLADTSSNYVSAFLSVSLPSLEEIRAMPPGGDRIRAIRQVQILWAILHEAGFPADETKLASLGLSIHSGGSPFDPGFRSELRDAIGRSGKPAPSSLPELLEELKAVNQYQKGNANSDFLKSKNGNPILQADELNMLKFLVPGSGSGVKCLSSCRYLHHKDAGNFTREIPQLLDEAKTVILDLSNAKPSLVDFLTKEVCTVVFRHQESLFTNNALGDRYVQILAEEAHNYFPASDKDTANIYARIAKEGAKYHIGLTYSTQSPSTISGELLSQTENFVVAHLDSSHEVEALVRRSAPFEGVGENILHTRTPGYVHLLTASQRYPIPVQIKNFREVS